MLKALKYLEVSVIYLFLQSKSHGFIINDFYFLIFLFTENIIVFIKNIITKT